MYDCIIIGGGVSGLLTAQQLQAEGLTVCLVERGEVGKESSWAGGGILSPLYPWRYPEAVTRLARWSQQHYPDFFNALHQRTACDPEYIRNGLLIIGTEERQQAQTWAAYHTTHLECLDTATLHSCEPELNTYTGGVWLPDTGQVRNPRLLQALLQDLKDKITIKEHCPVTQLIYQQGRITGVETPEGTLRANTVVVTTGAWTQELIADTEQTIDIKPMQGQMILFKTHAGLISRIVLANGHYIIPRRDGHVVVGSTLEDVGFDKHTTAEALENLKYSAFSLIPRLADYTVIKQWAGLRPAAPQGIPYITAHPEITGLYINAGHFRNGIVLGLASARLTSDLILQRPPIVDPSPYHLLAER